MWVATNATSGGITKYDGTTWTVYKTAQGLVSNFAWDLEFDGSGNLWIATNGGVSKFNGSSFTNYTSSTSGLSDNNTRKIAVDTNGSTIWVATIGGGVCKFTGTSWTAYKTTNSALPNNSVNAVDVDSAGNKWVGTLGGAARFTGTSWTIYGTGVLPSNSVYDVWVDPNDKVWFATTGGLARFDGTTWTTYTSENGMPSENTRSVRTDQNGILWAGCNGGGVCRYDGTSWKQYTVANSDLANNYVLTINIETSKKLWFGTNGGISLYEIAEGIILDKEHGNKPKR